MSNTENDSNNGSLTSDDEFVDESLEQQEQLTRERIGDDKVDKRLEQLANLSIDDTLALKQKSEAVHANIAKSHAYGIDSAEMQAVVQEYLAYSTFAFSTLQGSAVTIDLEKFTKMANSVANDADQKAAFENLHKGLAAHFSAAMLHYAKHNLK